MPQVSNATKTRVLVIANPIAGSGRGERTGRELRAALERAGCEAELHLTSSRGDGRARAARIEPGLDWVVAVGGDGTLGEVISGLPRRDVGVAVLPMGTANVLGLDLGLPRDVESFVAMLVRGRTQRVDTALVNGRLASFLVCGIGFDALVVRELEQRRRGPITKLAWAAAALRALSAWRDPHLEVEVDGCRVEGDYALVLVSNIVHYGGYDVLSKERALDDGLFEVYTFPARSRLGLLRHALRASFGRFPSRRVALHRARRVTVRAPGRVPFQVDGDLAGETPFELVVGSQPVRLLVP